MAALRDTKDYANLRLSFAQIGQSQTYTVTAAIDDGEPVISSFTNPLTQEVMRRAVATLADARSARPPATRVARLVSDTAQDGPELGETLAKALFTSEIAQLLRQAREQGRFRVALNLTGESELLAIPWEMLRHDGWDLASQTDSTVVRELDTNAPVTRPLVQGRLRMLVVIANPRGDLDVEGERRKIEETIGGTGDLAEVTFLTGCTYQALQRELQPGPEQRGPYHILHFVGHSASDAAGRTTLVLNAEGGGAHAVDANSIAQIIGGHRSLQLVVFNSCEGARTAADDPFTSFATMLVQQGGPAVIAMQFEISDKAAKAFAAELYHSLLQRRYPVDAAVAEARKAINGVSPSEFATPVLFLRAGSAERFNFVDDVLDSAVETPPAVPLPIVVAPDVATKGRPSAWRWAVPAAALVAVVVIGGFVFLGREPPLAANAAEAYATTETCLATTVFDAGPPSALRALPNDDFSEMSATCSDALDQLEGIGDDREPLWEAIDRRLAAAQFMRADVEVAVDSAAAYESVGVGLRERLLSECRRLRAGESEA